MAYSSISATISSNPYRFANTSAQSSLSVSTASTAKLGCNCGTCAQCGPGQSRFASEAAVFEKSAAAEALAARPENHGEPKAGSTSGRKSDSGLTAEEQEEVKELKKRDAEVRQHEYAHLAAAGPHALGGPTYEYETGPDGQRYAIGGEVEIDTSPVPNDPAATIEKAKTIRKAALAPAEPSSQDRQVAAQAAQMEAKARQELAAEAAEEQTSYYSPAGQKQPFASQPAIFDVTL